MLNALSGVLTTLKAKILVGVVATSIVAGGGVLAATGTNVLSDPASREARASLSADSEAAAKGKSAPASETAAVQANGSGAEASSETRAGRAGVAGSAGVSAGPGVAVFRPGAEVAGSTGGQPGGGGSSGGGGEANGPRPGISVPDQPNVGGIAPPASVPSEIHVHRSGSHTVVVPATEGDAQELCLKGTIANRCRTVTIPPTKAITLTFSYDGNASVTVPTFTVSPCKRGVEIAVQGLTPGSTVEAKAEGATLSAEVTGGREVRQAASFCKA